MLNLNRITVEDEYEKNPEINRKDIQDLLNWIKEQPHLPSITEYEAIQGLHSNYLDMERTKVTIDRYFTFRTHFTDIFSCMDIQSKELIQAHNNITLACLPGTTHQGYKVILWKWNDTDPAKFNFTACMKYYALFNTTIVYENGTCPGYVCFMDFGGSKLRHIFGLNLTSLRNGMRFIQEALPIRLRMIEQINFPFNAPLPIVRPFIKQELYHILRFRKSIDEVYETIPAEMFPCDYPGGKGPSLKELRENWWNLMNARRDQFLEEEIHHKVNESKRIIDRKSWFGIF